MALNWEVRDEVGVLSPVKLIISSCLSTVKVCIATFVIIGVVLLLLHPTNNVLRP